MAFAFFQRFFQRSVIYFFMAMAFGALLPTFANWYILAPLIHAYSQEFSLIPFILNGAWGVGAGSLYIFLSRRPSPRAWRA